MSPLMAYGLLTIWDTFASDARPSTHAKFNLVFGLALAPLLLSMVPM